MFRVSEAAKEPATTNIVAGGSKKGTLTIWTATTGQILAEIESAHYMEINDLDISTDNSDFIITGGKDCKVKIWQFSTCYHEFGDHQQEVTCVAFSKNNSNRAFSASTDKSFKVYDIAMK